MIPRTKVNYGWRDLWSAVGVGEATTRWRDELVDLLARLFDSSHILLTGSGRGALYLLFRALPHPRVLVPAYTCKAVVEAAQLAGKELLFGECEKDGFNMDADAAAALMGPDVIVVATHQFGIPCDIEQTVEQARRHHSFVLEDAAAAMGTRINGRLAGSFGDAAVFSFDSTKLINVPLKAGFLLVRKAELFADCQRIQNKETRSMPLTAKYRYLLLGTILVALENPVLYRIFHKLKFEWRGRFTDDGPELKPVLNVFSRYRMSEWQARLAVRQVAELDKLIQFRQRLYADYRNRLASVKAFILPPDDTDRSWACVRFPIRVKKDKLEFYRRACRAGVDFAFSFTYIAAPPEHTRAHSIAKAVLNLPFYSKLSAREFDKTVRVLHQIDEAGKVHADH